MSCPFLLFLEDVKLYKRQYSVTSEMSIKSVKDFLSKLTLPLKDLPLEEDIDLIYKNMISQSYTYIPIYIYM